MGLNFTPRSEKEIQEQQIAPAGEYDFEVLKAEEATSKAGNAMIKVNLGIYSGDAVRWRIFDYLLGAMEAKLRHFADTTGLLAKYESGELCAEDCQGRAGRLKLVVKDAEGNFPAKNEVKDYVVRKAKPLAATPVTKSPTGKPDDESDDTPF